MDPRPLNTSLAHHTVDEDTPLELLVHALTIGEDEGEVADGILENALRDLEVIADFMKTQEEPMAVAPRMLGELLYWLKRRIEAGVELHDRRWRKRRGDR